MGVTNSIIYATYLACEQTHLWFKHANEASGAEPVFRQSDPAGRLGRSLSLFSLFLWLHRSRTKREPVRSLPRGQDKSKYYTINVKCRSSKL